MKIPGNLKTVDNLFSNQGKAQAIDHLAKSNLSRASREIIKKYSGKPNLEDYQSIYASFNWEFAESEIAYFTDHKINAAYNAIDRHLVDGGRNKVALYAVSSDYHVSKYTFQEIADCSNKLGNALKSLNVAKGDRVFVYLPRIPELYISTIAIAKIGAVVGPLFSAFGPDALADRLLDSQAKVIITDLNLKANVDEIKQKLPDLEHIIVAGASQSQLGPGELAFDDLLEQFADKLACEPMDVDDPLYLLYTSGTTGKPKGVVHVHGDILGHHTTTKWYLDLKEDDVYWCTADPGWVTGTVYGIFGPWSLGVSTVAFAGKFAAQSWYTLIDKLKITVWHTAPTALRMLMKAGDSVTSQFKLESLRHIVSVGEPLNPEVVRWGLKVYGLPIHDSWWQTETGMALICNLPCMAIKPGSMGKPLPGIQAKVVDDTGNEVPAGQLGRLVVKPGWPAMLRAIWRNKEKFDEYFRIPGWYFSGDNAWIDEDGYFWFVGRADDVINTSGHRVGPFEVESALVEHPKVAEAGVIGKPDPERGEIIKAFVVLNQKEESPEALIEELKEFTKRRLAAHAYPKEIEIRENLPKTRSGKIMRRLLKAWELGLPAGDMSSLEED